MSWTKDNQQVFEDLRIACRCATPCGPVLPQVPQLLRWSCSHTVNKVRGNMNCQSYNCPLLTNKPRA